MSQDNVEIVRTSGRPICGRTSRKALSAFDPEVVWDGTNLPDGRIARGHQAILAHTARWSQMWESWTAELVQFVDAGDDVVVFIRECGRSKSGLDVDEQHAEVYTVRAGRIMRRRGFSDPREALEAVGVPPLRRTPNNRRGYWSPNGPLEHLGDDDRPCCGAGRATGQSKSISLHLPRRLIVRGRAYRRH
jgi:ketosteroid isomerase-like protein